MSTWVPGTPLPPVAGAEPRREVQLATYLSRMLIASGSFFFASFFFAFAMLHIFDNNQMWLPNRVTHPPMGLGVASVALLVAAGLVYIRGQMGLQRGEQATFTGAAGLALALGLAAAICYAFTLKNLGFSLQDGGYASVFFGLTVVYLIGLVSTLVFLLGLVNRSRLGLYARDRRTAVDAFAEFWGWYIFIGVAAYLVLYVVPFLSVE